MYIGGHGKQFDTELPPTSGLYVPGEQSMQVLFDFAPTAIENLPVVHFLQVFSLVAPIALLYMPFSPKKQPLETLYFKEVSKTLPTT